MPDYQPVGILNLILVHFGKFFYKTHNPKTNSKFPQTPPTSISASFAPHIRKLFYLRTDLLVSRLFSGKVCNDPAVIDHDAALTNCGLRHIASAMDGVRSGRKANSWEGCVRATGKNLFHLVENGMDEVIEKSYLKLFQFLLGLSLEFCG